MVACFEILLWVAVIYLFVFQMVVPTIRGTKIFPMFRREKKLRSEMVNVNQKILEKDLEKQIKTKKKKEGV